MGLWLSKITHLYHLAKQENIKMTIVSICGGKVPIDPESCDRCWRIGLPKNIGMMRNFEKFLKTRRALRRFREKNLMRYISRVVTEPCMISLKILICKR